ncbi:MAG: DUF2127 domain-containing protein [Chitinophagales bacterium]
MKGSCNKDTILNIGFYGGLVIKAVNAVLEIIGGLLMLIINLESLNRWIKLVALAELQEDPNDVLMNYLIGLGNSLSINSQHSAAVYMLVHGAIKVAIVWLLLKKIKWAFSPAMVVLGLFIAYEVYLFLHTHSLLMLLVVILDIAIIAVIFLEYRHLKEEQRL